VPFAAIRTLGGTVTNLGTISVGGATGIRGSTFYGEDAAVIVNSGVIEQLAGAATATGIADVGKIINTGVIRTDGPAITMSGSTTVINSGALSSVLSSAIESTSSVFGRVDNQRDGSITGGAGLAAIRLAGGSMVQNAGTIAGDVALNYHPYGWSSTGTSIYVNRGGTLTGNLTLSDGDDIFVAQDGATGVSGSIDTGLGLDTFAIGYTGSATVNLDSLAGSRPSGFERSGVGAYGPDTIVTLASASRYDGALLLVGDGTIVNTATINTAPANPGVQDAASYLRLGAPSVPGDALGAGSSLEFINQGRIENGVAGAARVFDNRGHIGANAAFGAAVAISANAEGLTWRNSGAIVGGNTYIYQGSTLGRVARLTFDNSGTIEGGIAIDGAPDRFTFINTGRVALPRSSYVQPITVSLGQLPAARTNADEASFVNGGVLYDGINAAVAARRTTFSNSGTIGHTGSAGLTLYQSGLYPEGQNSFDNRNHDQDSFELINSGAIEGLVSLYARAPAVAIENGGSMTSLFGSGLTESAFEMTVASSGDQTVSFRNSGSITASGLGESGVSIVSSMLSADGTTDGSGDASITLTNSGTIRADAGATFMPGGTNIYSPDDTLSGLTAVSIWTGGPGTGEVAVVNQAGATISAAGTTKVVNQNRFPIDDAPARYSGLGSLAVSVTADKLTLDNAGTISGSAGGVIPAETALWMGFSFPYDGLTDNYLAGAIQTFGSVDTLNNAATGVIIGSIDLGDFDDVVVNRGRIDGDLFLRTGNDSLLHALSGSITGIADGGDGIDRLTIDLTGGGTLDLARFLGFEDVSFIGSGALGSDGPLAIETVSLIGGDLQVASGQTLATAGPNTVTGTAANETLGNAGTVAGNVSLLEGNDAVGNRGTIAGSVLLGAGNDSLANTGSIGGTVDLGDGNDVFTNAGTVNGSVDLGGGTNTLVIQNGGRFLGSVAGGSGPGDVLRILTAGTYQAPFQFDGSLFTGFETLENGGGTTRLFGSFAGDINVLGGYLFGIQGSLITGDVGVGTGAQFGTAGTVNGNVTINAGGTLAPGASPGIMTVNGNVSLATGSTAIFEFVPAPGQSDQLLISGSLTIAANTTLTMTGTRPLTPGVNYDVIVANGGISGTFATVNQPATIGGFLRYTATRLQLMGTFVAPAGLTPQESAAVDYVNSVLISGTGSAALFAAVPSLLTADGTANGAAFNLLTPEPYATASQLGISNALAVVQAGRSGMARTTRDDAGPFAFAQGLGDWRSFDGHAASGTSAAESEAWGVLSGLGYGTASASLGAFIGYLDGNQNIAELGARTEAGGLVAGVAGHLQTGAFEFDVLGAYQWTDAETDRAVPGGRVSSSEYGLHGLLLDASVGYRAPVGADWAVRPALGVSHASGSRGAAHETGNAAFALDIDREEFNATFVDGSIALEGGQRDGAAFHPWLSAGVRHQIEGGTETATAGFAGGTSRFTVLGASRDATMVTAGAGIAYEIGNATLYGSYQGEFGDGSSHNANVGVRIRF
jgi:fibronectin-binding autotransporter adhesin